MATFQEAMQAKNHLVKRWKKMPGVVGGFGCNESLYDKAVYYIARQYDDVYDVCDLLHYGAWTQSV